MENVPFTKRALRNLCGKISREQSEDDVRKKMIDHELMSVILHRYCQADQEADEELPHLTWRHPLEPDYSTLVLSDFDYVHTVDSEPVSS